MINKLITIEKILISSLIISAGVYVFLSTLGQNLDPSEIFIMGLSTILFWGGGMLILLIRGLKRTTSRLYFSFILVLGFFHLGIPIGTIFDDQSFKNYIERWYLNEQTFYALSGVLVFLVGYFFALIFEKKEIKKQIKIKFLITESHNKIFFISFVVLIFIWVIFVRFIHGINNYKVYQENSLIPILSFVYVYVTGLIGFLFVALTLSSQFRRKSIGLFIVWSAFALPIGLRGEVMFPLAIATPFLISKGIIEVTLLKAVIALLTLLALISAIHHYRGDGRFDEAAEISPIAAIVEMGASLRPVHEVFRWISLDELNYFWGETYWAPFERLMGKLIPLITVAEANQDNRLMNVLIMQKAGPYGFSVIAEAYINFGWIGLLFIGFFCGYLLLSMDSKFKSLQFTQYSYINICIVYALFFHIRQSFVGAFGNFFLSFTFCFAITLVMSLPFLRRTLNKI